MKQPSQWKSFLGIVWVDRFLEQHGMAWVIRMVLLLTLYSAFMAIASGLLLWSFSAKGVWLVWFGLAMLLSAWNFYGLARFVYRSVVSGWQAMMLVRLLFGTQLRLLLTGVFVYVAIVYFEAPLFALVCGLTILLIYATLCGCIGKEHSVQ